MTNFSEEIWNNCLLDQDWSEMEECQTVDEMVEIFTDNVNKSRVHHTVVKVHSLNGHQYNGMVTVTEARININVGRMFRTDQKCPYLHAKTKVSF